MRKTVLYGPRNKNIAVLEQKNIIYTRTRFVGSKEQIKAVVEQNNISMRSGRKEQIIAVMEQKNIIYMRNRKVEARNKL
jgi:hypothetical protein